MPRTVDVDAAYIPSGDIIARQIHGELIIVPIVSGISDMDQEIFTLNETGQVLWAQLKGTQSLREIIRQLQKDFNGLPDEIERDVIGLATELVKRKILVKVERKQS